MNLNSDLGELAGFDAEILAEIDSANVCCGVHAGSATETIHTVRRCHELGVEVGAHPGYDDRPNFGRNAMEDFPMDGFVIPKGSHIHLSPFLMHRDARYYAEPLRFDPERWRPDTVDARPKYSYFPFGAGGMRCIAENFAWTQAILILAVLARRWRMRVAPGLRIELEPQVTLRSRYGMPLILERRKLF